MLSLFGILKPIVRAFLLVANAVCFITFKIIYTKLLKYQTIPRKLAGRIKTLREPDLAHGPDMGTADKACEEEG